MNERETSVQNWRRGHSFVLGALTLLPTEVYTFLFTRAFVEVLTMKRSSHEKRICTTRKHTYCKPTALLCSDPLRVRLRYDAWLMQARVSSTSTEGIPRSLCAGHTAVSMCRAYRGLCVQAVTTTLMLTTCFGPHRPSGD